MRAPVIASAHLTLLEEVASQELLMMTEGRVHTNPAANNAMQFYKLYTKLMV